MWVSPSTTDMLLSRWVHLSRTWRTWPVLWPGWRSVFSYSRISSNDCTSNSCGGWPWASTQPAQYSRSCTISCIPTIPDVRSASLTVIQVIRNAKPSWRPFIVVVIVIVTIHYLDLVQQRTIKENKHNKTKLMPKKKKNYEKKKREILKPKTRPPNVPKRYFKGTWW